MYTKLKQDIIFINYLFGVYPLSYSLSYWDISDEDSQYLQDNNIKDILSIYKEIFKGTITRVEKFNDPEFVEKIHQNINQKINLLTDNLLNPSQFIYDFKGDRIADVKDGVDFDLKNVIWGGKKLLRNINGKQQLIYLTPDNKIRHKQVQKLTVEEQKQWNILLNKIHKAFIFYYIFNGSEPFKENLSTLKMAKADISLIKSRHCNTLRELYNRLKSYELEVAYFGIKDELDTVINHMIKYFESLTDDKYHLDDFTYDLRNDTILKYKDKDIPQDIKKIMPINHLQDLLWFRRPNKDAFNFDYIDIYHDAPLK